MTIYKSFNSLLLNELQLISSRLDEIKVNKSKAIFPEEHEYYTFMIELLDSNLQQIQKKIKNRNIEQNKKVAFIRGRPS
jgi:hypothetical protein